MAQCEEQGFSGVTPAHFAELLKQGEALGIPIEGMSGHASRDGVTLEWSYDQASSTLKVTCTEAPFFVPCAMINGKIQSAVSEILAKTKLT